MDAVVTEKINYFRGSAADEQPNGDYRTRPTENGRLAISSTRPRVYRGAQRYSAEVFISLLARIHTPFLNGPGGGQIAFMCLRTMGCCIRSTPRAEKRSLLHGRNLDQCVQYESYGIIES